MVIDAQKGEDTKKRGKIEVTEAAQGIPIGDGQHTHIKKPKGKPGTLAHRL